MENEGLGMSHLMNVVFAGERSEKDPSPMLYEGLQGNVTGAASPSGIAKTEVSMETMLNAVDTTKSYPQVICLLPTGELVLKTGKVLEKMAGKYYPNVKIAYAARVSQGQKVTDHIIFGTPGTLLDLVSRHPVVDPKRVKMLVLDGMNLMTVIQGQRDHSIRLSKTLSKDCKKLLFSATYDEEVFTFATIILKEDGLDNIKQFYVVCQDKEEKFQALSNVYGVLYIGQCIVFCDTRKTALWLKQKMSKDGHAVALLTDRPTNRQTREQRIDELNRFSQGKKKLLITANQCGRGIDNKQVNVVVNFDMPVEHTGNPDCEKYSHRIGESLKSGIVLNFTDCQSLAIIKDNEEHVGRKISVLDTKSQKQLEKLNPFLSSCWATQDANS